MKVMSTLLQGKIRKNRTKGCEKVVRRKETVSDLLFFSG
jgi:hypothetical protein